MPGYHMSGMSFIRVSLTTMVSIMQVPDRSVESIYPDLGSLLIKSLHQRFLCYWDTFDSRVELQCTPRICKVEAVSSAHVVYTWQFRSCLRPVPRPKLLLLGIAMASA